MAENHPVGFQWVVDAREKGATVIHVDPRFTRTSAMADIWAAAARRQRHVFLGAMVNYVLTHGLEFRDYVVAYTNAATIIDDDLRRPRGSRRPVLGLGRRTTSGTSDTASWQPDATSERRPHAIQRFSIRARVFQILTRHFARYTPEMVEEVCGVPADSFLRIAERLLPRVGTGAHRRHLLRRRPGRSTRPACRSSGRQRSCSCCSATSGVPAAASSRCAATRRFRARPTSRRSTTSCRAICRCRRSARTMPRSTVTSARIDRRAGWWANFDKYVVSLLKAWYGDAGDARERVRLRLAAAHQRAITRTSATGSTWPTARHRGPVRDGTEPGRRRAERAARTPRARQPRVAGRA